MRASRPSPARRARAFTLLEVLAALMLMAIVVPVAMQGMGLASRAGVLGQRKAAAMRVADRVLNETVVSSQGVQMASSGTTSEGDASFGWTLESQTWTEDALLQLTVRVSFEVQGERYTVAATTLVDPGANAGEAGEPID
jgi:prepilin-type N-terminal cleavage/methylation domain-containing protein